MVVERTTLEAEIVRKTDNSEIELSRTNLEVERKTLVVEYVRRTDRSAIELRTDLIAGNNLETRRLAKRRRILNKYENAKNY